MSTYQSNATPQQIGQRLAQARRPLILSHVKPDGDSIGATCGLARMLAEINVQADVVHQGPIDPNLLELAKPTAIHRREQGMPPGPHDLIVIVDTGSFSQLDQLAEMVRPRREQTIVIDHHRQGDDLSFMRWVDPAAASATLMMLELAEAMRWPIGRGQGSAAEALFLGLATDTGWFRHDNADARAFAAVARLLSCEVNKTRLYQLVEENHRPQRLAMEARALASLEYLRDGAAAVMSLGLADYQQTGGLPEDTANLINIPLAVGAVRLSVLLTQTEPGRTKVSFRSKPPAGQAEKAPSLDVDVNQLARQFGGGGHIRAAGARLDMDLDAAKRRMVEAINSIG